MKQSFDRTLLIEYTVKKVNPKDYETLLLIKLFHIIIIDSVINHKNNFGGVPCDPDFQNRRKAFKCKFDETE